jgi:hypothetical protein
LIEQDREADQNDLVPFWLFEEMESAYKVERIVPMLPFSKESGSLDNLRKALAVYRMVFGQPRQEDLVASIQVFARNFLSTHSEVLLFSLEP